MNERGEAKNTAPRVVLIISQTGIEACRIMGDTDEQTADARAILEKIAPSLEVIESTLAAGRIRQGLIDPVDRKFN
jgi:hypothetical protein